MNKFMVNLTAINPGRQETPHSANRGDGRYRVDIVVASGKKTAGHRRNTKR
jgi:hypothetical protein